MSQLAHAMLSLLKHYCIIFGVNTRTRTYMHARMLSTRLFTLHTCIERNGELNNIRYYNVCEPFWGFRKQAKVLRWTCRSAWWLTSITFVTLVNALIKLHRSRTGLNGVPILTCSGKLYFSWFSMWFDILLITFRLLQNIFPFLWYFVSKSYRHHHCHYHHRRRRSHHRHLHFHRHHRQHLST